MKWWASSHQQHLTVSNKNLFELDFASDSFTLLNTFSLTHVSHLLLRAEMLLSLSFNKKLKLIKHYKT